MKVDVARRGSKLHERNVLLVVGPAPILFLTWNSDRKLEEEQPYFNHNYKTPHTMNSVGSQRCLGSFMISLKGQLTSSGLPISGFVMSGKINPSYLKFYCLGFLL